MHLILISYGTYPEPTFVACPTAQSIRGARHPIQYECRFPIVISLSRTHQYPFLTPLPSLARSRTATMSLPMHLRNYREKEKDELARDFFNIPLQEILPEPTDAASLGKSQNNGSEQRAIQGMDINAVFSVEGKEEVYVGLQLGESFGTR